MRSIYEKASQIKTTALVKSRPSSSSLDIFLQEADPQRFRYLEGKYIEEYTDAELSNIGKASVITDFMGPLACSRDLNMVLAQYLKLLKKDGKIFIFDAEEFKAYDRGQLLNFEQWLRLIRGFKITKLEAEEENRFVVRLTGQPIVLPRLELIQFEDYHPPRRVFEIIP
ncbi:MAG: hypothetical protein J0L93_09040 [Deltaproteobacteria bacterium]|nr:hypothetical protein [Deltaproteobacteria bacterium]